MLGSREGCSPILDPLTGSVAPNFLAGQEISFGDIVIIVHSD